ncbi:MFS transporter [Photorhabdus viridis]|uniref:MFS transporter n=1 Tax=Photorhabdus viridis TaxID=3163327 RepID=UPI003307A654
MLYIKFLSIGELFRHASKSMLLLVFSGVLYEETGSISSIGIIISFELISSIVTPSIASFAIKKYGSFNILKSMAFISLLLCFIAWIKLQFSTHIYIYILISFILSFNTPFIRSSIFCITPLLSYSHSLTKSNSYIAIFTQIGQLVGMCVAATIFKLNEFLNSTLLIAAIGYFISFVFYILSTKNIFDNTKEKIHEKNSYLKFKITSKFNSIALFFLILLSSFEVTYVVIFNMLLAPIVDFSFNNDKYWMSLLDSLFALGAIAGGVYSSKVKSLSFIAVFLNQIYFFILMIFYFNLAKVPILLFCFIFGFGLSISGIYWNSLFQKYIKTNELSNLIAIRSTLGSIIGIVISYSISKFFLVGFNYVVIMAIFIPIISCAIFYFVIYRYKSLKSDLKIIQ